MEIDPRYGEDTTAYYKLFYPDRRTAHALISQTSYLVSE